MYLQLSLFLYSIIKLAQRFGWDILISLICKPDELIIYFEIDLHVLIFEAQALPP